MPPVCPPLLPQVLRASSLAKVAPFLDPANDSIISSQQTRHRLLALSCVCPGASTLVANLLQTARTSDELKVSRRGPECPKWRRYHQARGTPNRVISRASGAWVEWARTRGACIYSYHSATKSNCAGLHRQWPSYGIPSLPDRSSLLPHCVLPLNYLLQASALRPEGSGHEDGSAPVLAGRAWLAE